MSRRHKGQWDWYSTGTTVSRVSVGANGASIDSVGSASLGVNRLSFSLPDGVVLRVEHLIVNSTIATTGTATSSDIHTPPEPAQFSADFMAGSFATLVEPGDAHTTALLLAMAGIQIDPQLSAPLLNAGATTPQPHTGSAHNVPFTRENTLMAQNALPQHAPSVQLPAASVTSRGNLALVITHAAMIPSWTIEQNLRLPAAIAGQTLAGSTRLAIPQEFLDLLGPLPPFTIPVADLDEETLQRVALLRALLGHPQALLIDHPAPRLASVLRVIADRARCAVIATTNSPDVTSWADRVIVLENGRFASESQVSPKSAWRSFFRRDPRPRPKVPDQVFAPAAPQPAPAQDFQPDASLTRPESAMDSSSPFAQGNGAFAQSDRNMELPPNVPTGVVAASAPNLVDTVAEWQPAEPAVTSELGQAEQREQPLQPAELATAPKVAESEQPAQPTTASAPPPQAASAAPLAPQQGSDASQQTIQPELPEQPVERTEDYRQLVRRMPIVNEPDPATQEIATLAVAQVQAIEKARRNRAAEPDPLRDELEQQSLRTTSSIQLPKDSEQTVNQAQKILEALPGPVVPS